MHIDYAKETLEAMRNQKHAVRPVTDFDIIKALACDEIVDLAAKSSDAKTASIAETMKQCFGYRNVSSKGFKKITDKQRTAIATSLLSQFGTADAVIEAAFSA